MPGTSGGREFRLYRDSPNTAWGFRLQGGKDLGQRLTVAKVTPCTPADGELHRGDVILEIQGNDAGKLTHGQARDLIAKSGGSLLVRVLSGTGTYNDHSVHMQYPSAPPVNRQVLTPARRPIELKKNIEFGTDYNRPRYAQVPAAPAQNYMPPSDSGYGGGSNFMLTRVQDSLSSLGGRPYSPGYGSSSYQDYSPSSVSPPVQPSKAPSWLQKSASPAPPFISNTPWRGAASPARAIFDEKPAWLGSLRSTNNPRSSDSHTGASLGSGAAPLPPSNDGAAPAPFKPKVQSMHYGADGSQEYRQSGHDNPSDTAKAAHLQYNSPMGLYSRQNVQDAMDTQLHGRPGEGTIGLTTNTEVQKMIQEEERGRARKGPEIIQSPSVRHLESQLGVSQANDTAISDF